MNYPAAETAGHETVKTFLLLPTNECLSVIYKQSISFSLFLPYSTKLISFIFVNYTTYYS